MKMNSKGLVYTLLFGALLAQSAEAGRLTRKGGAKSSGADGSVSVPSGGKTEVKPPSSRIEVPTQSQQACPLVADSEALSMEFLKNLFADENAKITLEVTPEGKFKYEIPRYYKACGDIVPVAEPIPDSKDYSVSVVVRKDGVNLTHDQILKCIEQNGKLDDGSIDHSKIEYNEYSPKIVSPATNPLPGFSAGTSSNLYLKWPSDYNVNENYPTSIPVETPKKLGDVDRVCFAYHKDDTVKGYLTERDLWLEKVEKACQGEKKAEEILKLKQEIKGIRSLSDMMDQISQALDGQYVLTALESADGNFIKPLSELETKISGTALKDRNRLIAEVSKYESLIKKMERDLVEPVQARINELTVQLSTVEGPEQEKIIEEIAKLKEGMTKLLRSSGANYNAMMQRLANEGISTQAKSIMMATEKTRLYIAYNEDKIKNFADISKKLKAYDVQKTEMTNLWKDLYAVKNGDKEPIERMQRIIAQDSKRLQDSWTKTQQSMQKKINKDCTGFFVNQNKCQKAIQAAQKERAQAERVLAKKSQGVQNLYKKRDMLYNGYAKYQEERAALEESEGEDSYADLGTVEDMLPSWYGQDSSSDNMSQFGYGQAIGMPQMAGQSGGYGGMAQSGMPLLGNGIYGGNYYNQGMQQPMMYNGSAMGMPMQ